LWRTATFGDSWILKYQHSNYEVRFSGTKINHYLWPVKKSDEKLEERIAAEVAQLMKGDTYAMYISKKIRQLEARQTELLTKPEDFGSSFEILMHRTSAQIDLCYMILAGHSSTYDLSQELREKYTEKNHNEGRRNH
jgi:hypothetical protein